jgi:hypothetical protein
LSTPVAAQPVIHHVRIGNWQEIAAIVANQNCPNWCWAAASEMLVKSQGVCDIPQEEFVRRIYGPGLPCLPTFGSLEPIRVAITGVYDLPDGSQVALTGAYHYWGTYGCIGHDPVDRAEATVHLCLARPRLGCLWH